MNCEAGATSRSTSGTSDALTIRGVVDTIPPDPTVLGGAQGAPGSFCSHRPSGDGPVAPVPHLGEPIRQ
jgi:hypothetical protein